MIQDIYLAQNQRFSDSFIVMLAYMASALWYWITFLLDNLNRAICWAGSPGSRRNSDALPLGIPLKISKGLHDHFKSSDDWLDDWEEIDKVEKKPFTFDDRVDAYRRNIARALKKTEKREEKEDEVDLMFADIEPEDEWQDKVFAEGEIDKRRTSKDTFYCQMGASWGGGPGWEEEEESLSLLGGGGRR